MVLLALQRTRQKEGASWEGTVGELLAAGGILETSGSSTQHSEPRLTVRLVSLHSTYELRGR